jgi:hypothetical protein
VTSLATFLANLSSTATYLAAPEITVGRAVAIGGLGALFVPGDPGSYTHDLLGQRRADRARCRAGRRTSPRHPRRCLGRAHYMIQRARIAPDERSLGRILSRHPTAQLGQPCQSLPARRSRHV